MKLFELTLLKKHQIKVFIHSQKKEAKINSISLSLTVLNSRICVKHNKKRSATSPVYSRTTFIPLPPIWQLFARTGTAETTAYQIRTKQQYEKTKTHTLLSFCSRANLETDRQCERADYFVLFYILFFGTNLVRRCCCCVSFRQKKLV